MLGQGLGCEPGAGQLGCRLEMAPGGLGAQPRSPRTLEKPVGHDGSAQDQATGLPFGGVLSVGAV